MLRPWKIGLLTVATIVMTAAPAAASYPALDRGTRGEDVKLLQRLLTGRDTADTITGLLGPSTEQLVKAFQARQSITADGVVRADTWRRLQPTLRFGASGAAVRALQRALNDKPGYRLIVNGWFDGETLGVVKHFQQQMGLEVDGIVGPRTWEAVTNHFVGVPEYGYGFYLYYMDGIWGTGNAVGQVLNVAQKWREEGQPERLGIGDLSLRHGGYFWPHQSHQRGVDVDIRIIRTDGLESPVNYWDAAYDRTRTQRLVDLLWATGQVQLILFNDENLAGVTPSPGHDSHMHVRFKR